MRFKIKEITFLRIISAFKRKLINVPKKISWRISKDAIRNKKNLSFFRNKYLGKRCFLVANGPSLKTMDLSFLNNVTSFGLNRIYLAYDDMGFKNDFLVSINSLVLSQFSKEIESLEMIKFLNWGSKNYFSSKDDTLHYIYKSFFGKKFGKDISKSLSPSATVTYAALQIIYFMGFKEVVIIGMDHNFKTKNKNNPNKTEIRDEEVDVNHFHPNYFPKGSKWETPDLTSSEYFYKIARKEFELDNRKIFDCTIGGKCQVFEKADIKEFI